MVQWIERWTANRAVRVQFLVGTLQTSFVSIELKEVWQGRVKAGWGGACARGECSLHFKGQNGHILSSFGGLLNKVV